MDLGGRLAKLVTDTTVVSGANVVSASMDEFETPSVHVDVKNVEGLPEGAGQFRQRLENTWAVQWT